MVGGLLIAPGGLVTPWLALALLYALAMLFTFRLPKVEVAQVTSSPSAWVSHARDRFGVDGTGFGTMMAVFAVGQGLAALYMAKWGQGKRLSVPILYGATTWSVMIDVFHGDSSTALCDKCPHDSAVPQ